MVRLMGCNRLRTLIRNETGKPPRCPVKKELGLREFRGKPPQRFPKRTFERRDGRRFAKPQKVIPLKAPPSTPNEDRASNELALSREALIHNVKSLAKETQKLAKAATIKMEASRNFPRPPKIEKPSLSK